MSTPTQASTAPPEAARFFDDEADPPTPTHPQPPAENPSSPHSSPLDVVTEPLGAAQATAEAPTFVQPTGEEVDFRTMNLGQIMLMGYGVNHSAMIMDLAATKGITNPAELRAYFHREDEDTARLDDIIQRARGWRENSTWQKSIDKKANGGGLEKLKRRGKKGVKALGRAALGVTDEVKDTLAYTGKIKPIANIESTNNPFGSINIVRKPENSGADPAHEEQFAEDLATITDFNARIADKAYIPDVREFSEMAELGSQIMVSNSDSGNIIYSLDGHKLNALAARTFLDSTAENRWILTSLDRDAARAILGEDTDNLVNAADWRDIKRSEQEPDNKLLSYNQFAKEVDPDNQIDAKETIEQYKHYLDGHLWLDTYLADHTNPQPLPRELAFKGMDQFAEDRAGKRRRVRLPSVRRRPKN